MPATVTIALPCFDAERWVGRALESALAQTCPVLEVLALDDGSTDGTLGVLRSFGKRVRVLEGDHRGAAAARNGLLAEARGEWVQFLDADDVIEPGKIAAQLAIVEREGPDLVVAPMRMESGLVLHATGDGDPWLAFMEVGLGCTSSNLWRREAVLAVGGMDETLACGEDYDLILRLLVKGCRIAVDPVARTLWGRDNPRSLSRRDPAVSRVQLSRTLALAAAHLASTGGLTEPRRTKAVRNLLRHARDLRRSGSPRFREVESLAREVHGRPWEALREVWPIYALVYRFLGFAAAEAYDGAMVGVRPVLRRLRPGGAGGRRFPDGHGLR